MPTSEAVLRAGMQRRDGEIALTLDPAFQGLPDTAHGGTVLAAFLIAAREVPPRDLRGLYRKRVPLGEPLRLVAAHTDGAHTFVLLDAQGATLVEGAVNRATPAPAAPGPGGPVVDARAGGAGDAAMRPLPVSSSCFACGVDNPLGLRVRLTFDATTVRGTWEPRDEHRGNDGRLAPLAVTTLLDEAAFWLGVLATGESGMTTDLAVTVHNSVPFGRALVVEGARASVKPTDDPRYLATEVAARDESGMLVATARITFVAVRGAARRLANGMLKMNGPDVIRAVFPAYVK